MADSGVVPQDFYVYVLFRPTGQPFYVGKGKGCRMGNHIRAAKRGEPGYRNRIIRKALSACDVIPSVKIASGLTENEAFAYEVAWIAALGRIPHGPLVNATDGGDGASGMVQSEYQREIMRNRQPSEALREVLIRRNQSDEQRAAVSRAKKGSKQSAEVLARLSIIRKGRRPSEETRRKMSETQKRIGNKPPSWYGRKHSEVTLAKMSFSRMGKPLSDERRAKLSLSHMGLPSPRKGSVSSETTREKMRLAWIRWKMRQGTQ